MKKVIALMLCMLLLLSGCSYAAGSGEGIQLRDLLFTQGGNEALDLHGLSGSAEFARGEGTMGLRFSLVRDELTSQAVVAVVDGQLLITLDGGTGEPCTYAVADPETVAAAEQTLNGLFPEAGPGEELPDFESMTDEELDAYMAGLEAELEAMGQSGEDEQLMGEALANLERIEQILQSCVSEGEPQQYLGDTYSTTDINLDNDSLMELLDLTGLAAALGEDTSMEQLLAQAGVSVEMNGVIAVSEDGGKTAYGLHPVITTDGGECLEVNMTLQNLSDADTIDIYLDAALNDEPLASLSVTMEDLTLADADWLPEEVSADVAVLDPEDEESLDGFVDDLSDFLGQAMGSVIGVSLGNRLTDALN